MDVAAGLLDHGAGGVLLDEDDLEPAGGLDLRAELLAGDRVLQRVDGVVQRVEVARLHPGVAALVQVDEVPLGERDLVAALLGADHVEALVLALAHHVFRALEGELLGDRLKHRPPGARLARAGLAPEGARLPETLGPTGLGGQAGLLGDDGQLRQNDGVARVDPVSVLDVLVLVPDLGPEVGALEVARRDVPERVAADHDVVGRTLRDLRGVGRVLRPVGSDRRRPGLQARRGVLREGDAPGQHEYETTHHELRSHCLSSRTEHAPVLQEPTRPPHRDPGSGGRYQEKRLFVKRCLPKSSK